MEDFKNKLRYFRYQLKFAKKIFNDKTFYNTYKLSKLENSKLTKRTEIISYLINKIQGTKYLEIGVRNPADNFNKIKCKEKYSVDPGLEFKENPVDFNLTSDDFFNNLKQGKLRIPKNIKFDVIFVDGHHLAGQVEKDINNSLDFLSDNGFIILHDCNPPTEFHARENYKFKNTPARGFWNGTTWKAFSKIRYKQDLFSICFNTDWGVGVISKFKYQSFNNLNLPMSNPYFEYDTLFKNRKEDLNLINFNDWFEMDKNFVSSTLKC